MKKIILVLDCGATNVRTIAVDETGSLVAHASLSNNTQSDPYNTQYKIWDINEIWKKLVNTTQQVLKEVKKEAIAGVTVTTFGVDCAPVNSNNELLYPVISWACQRTSPIMDNINKYIELEELYKINGVNQFSFNTINKLIWFKENKPEIFEQTRYFVFISALILQKLSGNLVSERTMAGTSMLTDIETQNFSDKILGKLGCSKNIFPEIADAGGIIGKVTDKASTETGIPKDIPVVAAGHDTQFAIFGSGAKENQPVLSTGTWEILMVRTPKVNPNKQMLDAGVTTELDAKKGLYTPGLQWLGSGVLEWIKKMFYVNEMDKLASDALYQKMISDAEKVKNTTLQFNPDFLNNSGLINGLGLDTQREEIYYAAIKALANKTKESLQLLEKNCSFNATEIICVGGGSKNKLWNKERAKALGIPVLLTQRKETTVLGAALFALAGVGIFKSADEARNNVNYEFEEIF